MSYLSEPPEWISPRTAERILGISRNTLKRLVQEGIVPAYKVEGVVGYRFKRPEVEAVVKRVVPKPVKKNSQSPGAPPLAKRGKAAYNVARIAHQRAHNRL